ncbi:hypothetical protein [Petrotoga mexicana]|jgi:hypothetical protein|uniref:hypothetical protein n=1 Tax=Petrotoga mexicana TaxID=204046 RepID=UPI0011AEDE7E|nr:hypothetical protein [Petrotoga mexicana]
MIKCLNNLFFTTIKARIGRKNSKKIPIASTTNPLINIKKKIEILKINTYLFSKKKAPRGSIKLTTVGAILKYLDIRNSKKKKITKKAVFIRGFFIFKFINF